VTNKARDVVKIEKVQRRQPGSLGAYLVLDMSVYYMFYNFLVSLIYGQLRGIWFSSTSFFRTSV